MEQYNNNKGKNNKYITKRLDSKCDIKRKYKLNNRGRVHM